MAKKYGRYQDHPHVITDAEQRRVERFKLTPDEFALRYRRLTSIECPEGSTIEVPPLLIHDGFRSGLA